MTDSVGWKDCSNESGNIANECSDAAPGARLYIAAIKGTSPQDLWAFGSRADIPGGRVYRTLSRIRRL